MISAEKQTLRLRMLDSLRAMSDAEHAEKSSAIARHLAGKLGEEPGLVFGFAPLRLEPDWTDAIGARWDAAFPRIEGAALRFHRVANLADLGKGALGAGWRAGGEIIPVREAAAILVPGVAFDFEGARLGRGGGFYDRLLASPELSARRIGICFSRQIVGRVPIEPHDAEVDAIVTEDGWNELKNSGRDRG